VSRKPFIFIGSSSEGLRFAEAIQLNLSDSCECQIWHQGLFGLSDGTLEALVKSVDRFDFAVLILTEDDLTISRDIQSNSPRDNVIFELGLFMGGLGRHRVYIVANKAAKLKLPTDLAGITIASFEPPKQATLQAAMGPASSLIKRSVDEHGLRQIVASSIDNYQTDLKIITAFLKDKKREVISFERLLKFYPKYDEDYVMKIIEANPDKIRKGSVKGGKPGIKIL
jgi:hypothetical protein